jgi:peptide/nickel transport system permease protein
MRGSTPASATAEVTVTAPPPRRSRVRRRSLRNAAHYPALLAGALLTGLVVTVALLNERLAPGYVFATSAADRLSPPSVDHVMGTDQLGRDLFTGVVRGAHTSLGVVAGVVVIAAVIGVVVGALSALRGGVVDDVVLRVIETVQTVPRFFLAVLVVGWFGPGTPVTVLLGLTSWPFLARVVRAETLSLRERAFVEAARAAGAGDLRVLVRHVVPNIVPGAAVVLALVGSRVVLLEAGLAFLGLADANVASWGALVNNAQPYLATAWWMSVFPGGAIAVTVLGMNLLSDGLAGLADPMSAAHERRWRGGESSLGG